MALATLLGMSRIGSGIYRAGRPPCVVASSRPGGLHRLSAGLNAATGVDNQGIPDIAFRFRDDYRRIKNPEGDHHVRTYEDS